MVLVENCLSLVQIDRLHLRLLPGKRRHEVQVVVQITVLWRILPLLLHARQHLVRFPARRLVHSRIFNLLLQLTDIGNILRVHLIELLLQIFHLLADRLLTIRLLVIVFLRLFRLIGNDRRLRKLIDGLFDQVRLLGTGVCRKNRIAAFRIERQPLTRHHGQFTDGVKLIHPAPCHLRPWRSRKGTDQRTLHLFQAALLILERKILFVGLADHGLHVDGMILIESKRLHLHTGIGLDLNVSV